MALQTSTSHRDDGKSDFNTVFIDTNLDTHLALLVSDADTVSDFRKRIMLEHPLCFPKIGQIQVHAIKVKRKGLFYHLSDSMLVRSAFSGFGKSWFLSVDASALMEHEKNQISNSPTSSNQVACRGIANKALICAIDNPLSCPSKRVSDFNSFESPQFENRQDEKKEVPFVSPCVSEHSGKGVAENLETGVKRSGNDDAKISTPGPIPETKGQSCIKNELPSSHIECEVDGSSQGNKDECNVSEEGTLKSVPSVKKKRGSIRKKEDTVQDDAFKDKNAPVLGENNINDEASKETEIPKEHSEYNNNNIDAECNKSMKETSETGSGANKKHRKRKRSLTLDSKEEMLKVESASQQAELHKSNKAQKISEEPKEQFEFNNDKSGAEIEFQHNQVSQEPSDTRSSAKKKRKGKERIRDESALEEKRTIVSDIVSDSNKETLKPENVSQHSVEDLQKIKNCSADQSTEHFDDADPLKTSVLGSRRKRKKNSSNHHQTAAGTCSRNDDEAEHSRNYSEGVQEEIHKDSRTSKDISVSKIAGDNIEIGTDACKKGTTYKVKRTGNSKDHCAIDMKVHPSDLNEPKEITEDNRPDMHENIALDDSHLSEAGQIEQAGEGREISLLDDPKPLPSENCIPINQNSMDANVRELNVTSKVLKATGTTECGKSEKKRRKRRNAKDSGGGTAPTEGLSCVDAYKSDTFSIESHKAKNCDPTSGKTKTEENLLNKTEGENVPLEKMKRTSLSAIDREVNGINAGSLEKISKTEAHAENVREKKSKKSMKKQTPTTDSVSEMVTKDQVLDHKEQSPTSESRKLEEPSKITKKNKSASIKSTNKPSGPILEAPHSLLKAAEGNYKPPLVVADTAVDSMLVGDEDDNHLEAPSKSDKINAEQHFASEQQQHKDIVSDDISVDKNGTDRTDIELMTRKNRSRLGINHDKNVSKVHRTGQEVQLSSQSNSVTSTIEENKRPQVNKASGKNMKLERKNEAFPASDSKLKGFKKMVENKVGKASGNNIEGVMSKKEQKKSLLAGTIFKDDSSGTSEDKDEKDNHSNSSTRTPSDNSFSSDYSDGDSHAGSYGRKGLETSGRSSIKSCLSGAKAMPIDSILRSSSSYKKAKLTASQMEETESQQVDFVPDSLADT